MAEITYTPETEISLPNITIVRKYADGIHAAYQLTPNEGYVMHNPNNDDVVEEIDPVTGETVTVTYRYYYRFASIPASRPDYIYNWTAVLESEVPADSIFGGGDNNTEIM